MSILTDSYRIFNHTFDVLDKLRPCLQPWPERPATEPCQCDNCVEARDIGDIACNIVGLVKEVKEPSTYMERVNEFLDRLNGDIP